MSNTENQLAKKIIGCAIEVHRELGPGLFESVYEVALTHELIDLYGFKVERQKHIPIEYKGIVLEQSFIADLIVEDRVLIELKSIRKLEDIHKKQTLTYLRLTGLKLGLLINFNETLLTKGLKRIVNGLED